MTCTVCLVDEMDYLLSKDSSILYNFFSWPMQRQSGLIFIGVANTTNLPEVLTARLQSRLDIHREVFKPYSHEQVQQILKGRLADLALEAFSADNRVIEYLARKAIIVAGDLRAAMKICQRFVEMLWEYKTKNRNSAAKSSASSSSSNDNKNNNDAGGIEVAATEAGPGPVSEADEDNERTKEKEKEKEKEKDSKMMMKMVNDAVSEFRQNPFLFAVKKASLLEQALLLQLSNYRLQCGSGGGADQGRVLAAGQEGATGGAAAVGDGGLTVDELWDRLKDVAVTHWPAFHSSSDDSSDQDSDGNGLGSGSNHPGSSNQDRKRKRRRREDQESEEAISSSLLLPPFFFFERALDGLLSRSLLVLVAARPAANPRSGRFYLNPRLTHADIIAALRGTCLEKHCRLTA